jgi:uncharacterized protein YbbC (DUF1343 family)
LLKQTDVSEVRTGSIVIAQLVEAVRSYETSVYYNETMLPYIPKSPHLHKDTLVFFYVPYTLRDMTSNNK